MAPHTKPGYLVVLGFFSSLIQGAIFPIFAIFLMEEIFQLSSHDIINPYYPEKQWESDSEKWIIYMALAACVTFVFGFCQKAFFGLIGENITLAMRSSLYRAFLTKHIGWFDDRENAPGILTSALANDTSVLNGVSTEGIAVIMEAGFAILVGIIIGFSFNWKIACVSLACTPFMAIGGAINAKFQTGMAADSAENFKDANLLVGDTITNYRTVASFANNGLILDRYQDYLLVPYQKGLKSSHQIGVTFGFSQFVQFATFAVLFYSAS